MPANVKSMAYVGQTPWHQQGCALGDRPVASSRMIKAAGLDWDVELVPVFAIFKGKPLEVPGRRAVVRCDTNGVLGEVTDNYHPFQNRDLFKFTNGLVGKDRSVYHTAGALGEGEKVWALLKLPQVADIVKGDPVGNYILAANAHDGTFRLRFKRTRIRVVCWNTFVQALSGEGAEYAVAHTARMEGKMNVEAARAVLGVAGRDFAEFVDVSRHLASLKFTDRQQAAFVDKLFPITDATPEADIRSIIDQQGMVHSLIQAGKGNDLRGVRGTRWAALNGVVEYADYLMGGPKRRTENLLWGQGAKLKQQAYDLLVADLRSRRN